MTDDLRIGTAESPLFIDVKGLLWLMNSDVYAHVPNGFIGVAMLGLVSMDERCIA